MYRGWLKNAVDCGGFVVAANDDNTLIIPALIGAAVAYTISGEASASENQSLHEVRSHELNRALLQTAKK